MENGYPSTPPPVSHLLQRLICISQYRLEALPFCWCQELCFGATARHCEKWDSVCYAASFSLTLLWWATGSVVTALLATVATTTYPAMTEAYMVIWSLKSATTIFSCLIKLILSWIHQNINIWIQSPHILPIHNN